MKRLASATLILMFLFGLAACGKPDTGEDTKIEVKWAGEQAELLIDEWIH